MAVLEPPATAFPHAGLLHWLDGYGVPYAIHEHAPAFSALETARRDGVDPITFAKVVAVVTADGQRVLTVLDAFDELDLRKVGVVLESRHVRLLTEDELAEIAPDCEIGAAPAIGGLFGPPTYADIAIRAARRISFNAATHCHSVRVDRHAWERAASISYADLVRTPSGELGYLPIFELFDGGAL